MIEFIKVSKPNSYFKFISQFCKAEADGNVNRALHRLCSLMRKMDAKVAIAEDIDIDNRIIIDECKALDTYFEAELEKKIHRLTFILDDISDQEAIDALEDKKFIGTSILINYKLPDGKWQSYLFNAIVTSPKKPFNGEFIPLLNNYLHIYKCFDCEACDGAKKFKITGSFFAQQNGVTSVCAHASLCMTLNNIQLPPNPEVNSEFINKIIGVDHKKRKFKVNRQGLTKSEILQVLKEFGLKFIVKDHFTDLDEDYDSFIYKYIESKFPALLVFTSNNDESHIVPILGHTLNTDMWRPEADIAYNYSTRNPFVKPASAYVDHFIMHDDNFGMYFCLPVDSLKKQTLPKYDHRFRAYYSIVIIPDNVKTPSWEAEQASTTIADRFLSMPNGLDEWSNRLKAKDRPWVVRTFMITREDYQKSLTCQDFSGNRFSKANIDELLRNLPDRFWLSEITLPDLYTANKHKILDLFYPCDLDSFKRADDINKRWIQLRAPSVLIRRQPDTVDVLPMDISNHYPLVRLDSEVDVVDW